MEERATALGGELNVQSRPGHGARLELRVPLSAMTSHARQ